ncbi:MAG: molybdopterin-dependent oxidoreductase [Sedimentibacter sp.]|uniref:molybdopterin-dependent oxidoreductase n=1 Tax=Sedimentibacter sp. TaxID=1960295 RepID=UPI00315879A9
MKRNLLIVLILSLLLALVGCAQQGVNTDASSQQTEESEKSNDEESNAASEKSESDKHVQDENRPEETLNTTPEKPELDSEPVKTEPIESSIQEKNEERIGEEKALPANEPAAEADDMKSGENVLKVEGLASYSFTLEELKKMDDIIFEADFYSLNSFGTTGYTHFKGVRLWELLNKTGMAAEASKITVVALDGYKMEFTMEQVKKQDYMDETNPDAKYPMIIAWEENGTEYNPEDGAPYKLVVGQKEAGDVNKPQWVSNVDKIVVK